MTNKFHFITDTHFRSSSNVRIGDYRTQLLDKLRFVIDMANHADAVVIVGGDVFDTPAVDYETYILVYLEFMKAKHKLIVIPGNHDILYHSMKLFRRTSLYALIASEAVQLLTEDLLINTDVGEFYLKPGPPTQMGKPQITMFHGFLNQEDGPYTFRFTDILSDDPYLVLLGHDHVVYEDIQYKNGVIIRPGSFVRGLRTDASLRTPQVVEIEFTGTSFKYEYKPILTAVNFEIAFKPKPRKAEVVDFNDMLQNLASFEDDRSFESLLKASAPVHVVEYINNLLNKRKL